MSEKQVVVAELRKNEREDLRISIGEYKGVPLLNLRVWYRPADGGEMRPGRDGLALKVEHLEWLRGALERAQAEADRLREADAPG